MGPNKPGCSRGAIGQARRRRFRDHVSIAISRMGYHPDGTATRSTLSATYSAPAPALRSPAIRASPKYSVLKAILLASTGGFLAVIPLF